MADPIRRNQSKHLDSNGVLRYSADDSEVFPGPTGVRRWQGPLTRAETLREAAMGYGPDGITLHDVRTLAHRFYA